MLVPHIIFWSLVKSSLNKRKLMVRRVLGGSEDIQGRSKGISRVSWKQVTIPPMQWKYVIWIECAAGCGALLVRWISRTLLHMGGWNILIRGNVQSHNITQQKNGHLIQDGVCHKIFDSDHWRTIWKA